MDSDSSDEEDKILWLEDFDVERDQAFVEEVVKPYFKTIFSDIAIRRHSPSKKEEEKLPEHIDKVAFFEYTNLPGIIGDRFYSLFKCADKEIVLKQNFVDTMIKVYISTFDTQQKMVFDL